MAAQQQGDKKPANYYGGYSLYRGGSSGGGGAAPLGNPSAAPPMAMQQARKMAAAFNADWFTPGMMPMMFPMFGAAGGAVPTPQQPLPHQQHHNVDKPVAAQAAPAPSKGTPVPFLGNFFPPPQNAYRGAPVRAGSTAMHAQHHTTQHHRPHAAPVPHASLAAAHNHHHRSAPVPHFSDTWNAFDGVATVPSQRHAAQHHLDPIGTPAPRSVWAGTPAGDIVVASQRAAASPNLAVPPTGGVKPFSVWSSTPVATPATATVASRSGASTPESREGGVLAEQHDRKETFAAPDVNSDDEDWVEHLKTTLHAVLADDEPSVQQQSRPVQQQKKQYMEMEWAGMKLQGA